MKKATILFADNDPDFCATRAEFLEHEGYRVLIAKDPNEARRLLRKGGIDLAIIDIRLTNDDDEKDASGLNLAKESDRSLPKILLTGFPKLEDVRQALSPQTDGFPIASDFLAKEEGPMAMIESVERIIAMRVNKKMSKDKTADGILPTRLIRRSPLDFQWIGIIAALVGVIANLLTSVIATRTLPNVPTVYLFVISISIAIISLLSMVIIVSREHAKKRQALIAKLKEKEQDLFSRIEKEISYIMDIKE